MAALSYYELAYLEINRIIIKHDIVTKLGIINKNDVDLFNRQVDTDIKNYPQKKKEIYALGLKELLVLVKEKVGIYNPPPIIEIYDYKNYVNFLKDGLADMDLPNKRARQVAKAIIRLDTFYNKYQSYLYDLKHKNGWDKYSSVWR